MADDEERTSSDSEAEAIEAAIEDSDEDVRYSLRSRRGSKLPTTSASTSTGVAAGAVGGSPAGIDAARGSVADPGNRAENGTRAVNVRPHDVTHDELDGMSRLSGNPGTSPFELMSALESGTSMRVLAALADVVGGTYPYASGGVRLNHGGAPRVDLPFQFNRSDIPYVPTYIGVSRALPPAGAYATRMTAREQGRDVRDGGREGRPRIEEGMLWSDYHRILEEQNLAGALAIERIARSAASASDKLDIYPAPRPLLVEGHRHSLNADRIGPVTREWETARRADESRVTGQELAAGPRRGRNASHS